MSSVMARFGSGGRLLIPADIRREMGVKDGDAVNLQLQDGVLQVITFQAGVRRAQAVLAPYMPKDRSLADELIKERRSEARRERTGS